MPLMSTPNNHPFSSQTMHSAVKFFMNGTTYYFLNYHEVLFFPLRDVIFDQHDTKFKLITKTKALNIPSGLDQIPLPYPPGIQCFPTKLHLHFPSQMRLCLQYTFLSSFFTTFIKKVSEQKVVRNATSYTLCSCKHFNYFLLKVFKYDHFLNIIPKYDSLGAGRIQKFVNNIFQDQVWSNRQQQHN